MNLLQKLYYISDNLISMKNSQEGSQNFFKHKSKQITHSEHLKNCKKVYDQLHRNQVNTFIVRRKHLQKYNKKPKSLNKPEQPILTQTSKYDRWNGGLPSIPSQQYLNPKSRSEPKPNQSMGKDNKIDIIKKMLQINSHLNKMTKDKDNLVPDYGNYNQINYRSSNIQGEQNDRVLFGESTELKEKTRKIKISRLYDESANELDYIKNKRSNRQSLLQKRNDEFLDQKRERNKSELKQNSSTPQNRKPKSLNQQNALIIENKILKTQSHFSHTAYNFLSLESYIKYIRAPEDIRELNITFNFSSLRKLTANEAWKNLDIKNAKMIENLLQNLLIEEYPRCQFIRRVYSGLLSTVFQQL